MVKAVTEIGYDSPRIEYHMVYSNLYVRREDGSYMQDLDNVCKITPHTGSSCISHVLITIQYPILQIDAVVT